MKIFNQTLIIIVVLMCKFSNAQQNDSLVNIFSKDYSQEKIFIHFDKTIYKKNETIWFKIGRAHV